MAPELFGTHVAAVDFGGEAHVDAGNFLGEYCCTGTEADGEELGGMRSMGSWRRTVLREKYLLRRVSVRVVCVGNCETHSLQLAHALK